MIIRFISCPGENEAGGLIYILALSFEGWQDASFRPQSAFRDFRGLLRRG